MNELLFISVSVSMMSRLMLHLHEEANRREHFDLGSLNVAELAFHRHPINVSFSYSTAVDAIEQHALSWEEDELEATSASQPESAPVATGHWRREGPALVQRRFTV